MAELMPVDEALERLLEGIIPLASVDVPLAVSAGRILAADIVARRTQPPFDASAMDGYAVRHADIARVPARLAVIGESIAGRRFAGTVGPGQAVRIFTGAPLPEGADTVILQEDTRRLADGIVEATEATQQGRHIRRAGLDFREGDVILQQGRRLDAGAISLAAAANHPTLPVVRRPLVAILATGTELVAPGQMPGPDQIVASNGFGVAALVGEAGGEVLDLGIVADDEAQMAAAIRRASEAGADVLVTLGGASVGDHDLVQRVLVNLGMQLAFWKIAMRPGKPLMAGTLGGMRVLGLPGNPVSSLVCTHLFVKPVVAALGGGDGRPQLVDAELGEAMKANDHRRDYVRARTAIREGRRFAIPFGTQDSSMLRTMAAADALIVREANAPAAPAGSPCNILLLR